MVSSLLYKHLSEMWVIRCCIKNKQELLTFLKMRSII
jgi:hypothetical protein